MVKLDEFNLIAAVVRKRSGLMLTTDKGYLIESRLLPVARTNGMQDVSDLCNALRGNPPESLLAEITEAMTTNESSFFRDPKSFEQIRHALLPMLMKPLEARRHIRIWSAACATGQEPYSLAMSLKEDADKMPGWTFDIIASDLAAKTIEKAVKGIYTQFEVQRGLSSHLLVKYFSNLPDTTWQLNDTIRNMVRFKTHNLLGDCAQLGIFDLILCRNVLIYFDEENKALVTDKLASCLSPQGLLILGSTETIVDPGGRFSPLPGFRSIYTLKQ